MTPDGPDRIYIRDLQTRCIIGINPDERIHKQDVIINITLETDVRDCAASDSIEDTVDYKSLKKSVLAMVEASSFGMIERLATGIAEICLAHPRVQSVTVSVDKPGALRYARSVAVEIARRRP